MSIPPPHARPVLSVVVPVYRNRATLEELHRRLVLVLESQTHAFEIIWVDDACPDASYAVLARIASRDARSVIVRQPVNGGQNRAVLAGLGRSRGDVVI